jgi:hypothetical protein
VLRPVAPQRSSVLIKLTARERSRLSSSASTSIHQKRSAGPAVCSRKIHKACAMGILLIFYARLSSDTPS